MGRAQEAGWVAGLVLGAGACYCVYRLAWGEKKSRKSAAEGGSRGCPAEQGRTSPQRGSSPSSPAEDDCTKSSSILDAQHLKKLICLLESTEDPLIRERALITLGNSAAFSVNQDVIRNLDGLLVIGNILKDPNPRVKEKALNALNNLSMNIQNQKEIKVYISQICEETISSALNSDVQLAGLRLLTNMTVTNDYHHLLASSASDFFDLLSVGNENTKIQTLKVLLNLSANPSMTKELLSVQVPSSLISLFDGNTEKEILLRVLTLFANLKNSIKQKENAFAQHQFNKSSLFSFLNGESTECTEKLLSLIYHHDVDVKEKVAEILTLL
ncbi:armadillo repeat-containing protein 10 isoform X1 [Phascolarctos cinereus]|uniref:Armadillo repeat-containing protein 10 isoform X1 n=1 Tax=Phascolarctos cinereus TaxID=38626 RepID=A0A6P5K5C1_PHACI|nr:armadillo repeat-containing protein 10 isoform X1 [Phascolarctos cinereus]